MTINRKQLISSHNPILTSIDRDSPLTVGNGELAFTADVTGMQSLYQHYTTVPLCTMSQWGWHTTPVSAEQECYTLEDLLMTTYEHGGKTLCYPKERFPGNEAVYDWLRQNPHRLNLARIGLVTMNTQVKHTEDASKVCSDQISPSPSDLKPEQLSHLHQELNLYTGLLDSSFHIDGVPCHVKTACSAYGDDTLAFHMESSMLSNGTLGVCLSLPYGASDITASDWTHPERHKSVFQQLSAHIMKITHTLDQDCYEILLYTDGFFQPYGQHTLLIHSSGKSMDLCISFAPGQITPQPHRHSDEVFLKSQAYFRDFWEKGGIIQLNQSRAPQAMELERRIILSQYLMAVNCCGSTPPQETGLTVNSWYGKMHLEMYLWHCAWLPLWGHGDMLLRSTEWYLSHLPQAQENARRNGYKGARWPKMIATEGIDCPSKIAPLLIWQQPHIIYMLEMLYHSKPDRELLEKYWPVIRDTADFMADFAEWNPKENRYDLASPSIPVQERHRETDTYNPAFELEYWRFTLRIACEWSKRLHLEPASAWIEVAEHIAPMAVHNDLYLAHEHCPDTFEHFNIDHPSMLGSLGLIGSDRCRPETMKHTLDKVLDCWVYPSLWGWDFAMMAMTAVRTGQPELAIEILLKETEKNCYLTNGHNMQKTRKDLPLYLPGNGSLLLAAAIMTAGYTGAEKDMPGFPKDGSWTVSYEGIMPFL